MRTTIFIIIGALVSGMLLENTEYFGLWLMAMFFMVIVGFVLWMPIEPDEEPEHSFLDCHLAERKVDACRRTLDYWVLELSKQDLISDPSSFHRIDKRVNDARRALAKAEADLRRMRGSHEK